MVPHWFRIDVNEKASLGISLLKINRNVINTDAWQQLLSFKLPNIHPGRMSGYFTVPKHPTVDGISGYGKSRRRRRKELLSFEFQSTVIHLAVIEIAFVFASKFGPVGKAHTVNHPCCTVRRFSGSVFHETSYRLKWKHEACQMLVCEASRQEHPDIAGSF